MKYVETLYFWHFRHFKITEWERGLIKQVSIKERIQADLWVNGDYHFFLCLRNSSIPGGKICLATTSVLHIGPLYSVFKAKIPLEIQ